MRIATLGICGLLLLTSCTSSGDDDDGPGPVADQLAEALAGKDLSGVPWRSTEPVDLESLFGPLTDVPAAVDVTKVDEQDDQATATLAWTWDFSGNEWTYETPAALTKTGNEWKVSWAPTIVEPSLKEGETLDVDTLLADRGEILGAGGRRLVKARDVVHYGLDKTMVKAAGVASSARRIAQVLDIDPAPYVKQAGLPDPRRSWRRSCSGTQTPGTSTRPTATSLVPRRSPARCRSPRPPTSLRRSSAGSALPPPS